MFYDYAGILSTELHMEGIAHGSYSTFSKSVTGWEHPATGCHPDAKAVDTIHTFLQLASGWVSEEELAD